MSQTILSDPPFIAYFITDWTKCLTQKCVFCSTIPLQTELQKNNYFGIYFKKCKVCMAANYFRFSA